MAWSGVLLPRTVIFSTITIDGKIASKSRFSQLSCPHDLKRLHELRAQCDAVMVGANTVIIDDPSLRLKYVEGRNPDRIIVDGMLRTPLNARVYTLRTAKTLVLTTRMAPSDKVEKLRSMGVEVLLLAERPPINMRKAMEVLGSLGYKTIMVEGGGELIWYLFKNCVVNELRVTIAPYIFGGRESVSLVMGEGFSTTAESPIFKLRSIERCLCGNEIHLIYDVEYRVRDHDSKC
ncbi:MAG: 2,5-diamino-6-(ribosylamino)-4(3H)-pyrimidinone 5'-phosphate reductase [Candidatus Nezhaarchaeales archaeon]